MTGPQRRRSAPHTVVDYDERRQSAIVGIEDGHVTMRVGKHRWFKADPDTAAAIGVSLLELAAAAREEGASPS